MRYVSIVQAALVASLGGILAIPAVASAQEIKLRMTTHGTTNSPEALATEWWMQEIEERSGGRVQIERFYLASLCPQAETTQCVRDGRADIGITSPSATPADFPITEIMNLPFLSTNPEAVMNAYMQLVAEVPEVGEEAGKIGLRAMYYVPAPRVVIGAKQPLASLEDLRGLRVRTIGAGSQLAIDAVGANPVSVVAGEMYEGMVRGVLDVFVNNLAGAADFKLYETAPYWYDPGMGIYVTNGVWIAERTLDALPEDVRQIVDDVTAECLAGACMAAYGTVMKEKCDTVVDAGTVEVFERWPAEVVEEWKAALGDAAVEAWKARATDAGVADAAGVYARYVSLLEAAESASTFVSAEDACMERF